ncbi:helix-turn-helix domain-containing protein [Streptomyces sp. NPDC049954]|uniref:helix-turn-helix domain-containing protein n=1 Tax=Streptomyces sp. NPDC049954 TaxID=3155779 RepID=UPI00343EB1CD
MLESLTPRTDPSMLACWRGLPMLMERAHRHDDIELNLCMDSELIYIVGGRQLTFAPGELVAFWAAIPHKLIHVAPETPMGWLYIPLTTFLGWRLPAAGVTALLHGEPVQTGRAGRQKGDADLLSRWQTDLSTDDAELHRIALLEMEARMRRLVHQSFPGARDADEPGGHRSVEHAARMAQFISAHFRESLTAERIAASIPLHPHYAMTLFKEVLGTTLNGYINQCRVADSQRLLITTDRPVAEISAAVGFGSLSSFYAHFTETCDTSPGSYRKAHHGRTPFASVAGDDPVTVIDRASA